jgi:hypothetical protein
MASSVDRKFVGALLFLGSAVGCGADADADIATTAATRGDLVFASSYYGEIEAAEAHPVYAPEMRNIWQVTVESVVPDGTRVKTGDTIITFANYSERNTRFKQHFNSSFSLWK